jgi:hypothetical protein
MQAMKKDDKMMKDSGMQSDMREMQEQMPAMTKSMGKMVDAMEHMQTRMESEHQHESTKKP